MLFKKQAHGKTLHSSKPLLTSVTQGYIRPSDSGNDWFQKDVVVWRTAVGFSNYEVSNFGDVRRSIHKNPRTGGWKTKKPGDPIKVCCSKLYPYVHIVNDDGILKTKRVSNLVCWASYGDPPLGKTFALHKDDNPRNNHSSNLYWGNQKENTEDKTRNGFCQKGELGPNSKFSNEMAAKIRAERKDTGIIYAKLAKKYGVAEVTVRNICIGKTYKGA